MIFNRGKKKSRWLNRNGKTPEAANHKRDKLVKGPFYFTKQALWGGKGGRGIGGKTCGYFSS